MTCGVPYSVSIPLLASRTCFYRPLLAAPQYQYDPFKAQESIDQFRKLFGNKLEPVAQRKDPLDSLNTYYGGYNITDRDYIATAVWAGGWPLILAGAVLLVALLTLLVRCCMCCCCHVSAGLRVPAVCTDMGWVAVNDLAVHRCYECAAFSL